MQNVLFRMSTTPGAIRFAGRAIGADNHEIMAELGHDAAFVDRLVAEGIM